VEIAMHYAFSKIIPIFFISTLLSASETFQLILEPRWDLLDRTPDQHKQEEKLILIAKITFKKKIAEQVTLQTISFHWHGEPIENLSGSLYKKESSKEFIPIEKNVICDSQWNKDHQVLLFNFPKAEKLNIHSEFCLVLTIPITALEIILKAGHFSIEEKCLPDIMQQSSKNDTLTIAFSDIECKKIISLH
jgi:hypothetical protein